MPNSRVAFFTVFLMILFFPASIACKAQTTTTSTSSSAPTPSEGTGIGTIIKDAIEVALPNTTKLIDAIFGASNTAKKPAATAAVAKQVDTSTQAANAQLKSVSAIAAELNVVSEYLEQSVPASQRISRLLTRLDDAPAGTIPASTKADWDEIAKGLQKLSDIKASEINAVQPGLRLTLIQIQKVYDANQDDITTSINKKDGASLKTQLRGVAALLDAVVSIAGIEITDLQQGLSSVAVKASGATPQGVPSKERIQLFKDQSSDAIAAAKVDLPK